MNRGDVIRSMSNEELADFFQKMFQTRYCLPWDKPTKNTCWKGCRSCWVDWLNKEARREKPEYERILKDGEQADNECGTIYRDNTGTFD